MSKILVIQPYPILRHALAVALAPDYRVEVVADLPKSDAPADADLIIVDGQSLQEREQLGADELRAIQAWNTPVIWINAQGTAQAPECAKCIRLTWPLDRGVLKKAVAQSLKNPAADHASTSPPSAALSNSRVKLETGEGHVASLAKTEEKKLIELVDVVE